MHLSPIIHERARELIARLGHMASKKVNFEDDMQEISDLGMPFRGDVSTIRTKGGPRIEGVFDTTMMLAALSFAGFIKGTILPAGTKWLRVMPPSFLDGIIEVKALLDRVASKVAAALYASNFYVQAGTSILDLAVLGNQTMAIEEDTPKRNGNGDTFGGFIFTSVPIRRVHWITGRGGIPSIISREFTMPSTEAYRHFKGNAGRDVDSALNNGRPMEEAVFTQFIYKNENEVPHGLRPASDAAWNSDWLAMNEESGEPEFIKESGMDERQLINTRWMVVDGEEWGRGRGNVARLDAKGVSELKRQVLIAAGREINPPLLVEEETAIELDVGPHGLNIVRPFTTLQPQYLKSGTDFAVANEIGNEDRKQINEAFYKELIRGPEIQERSATATQDRQIRALQELSAPADIMDREFLAPIVATCISMMRKRGALPELDLLAQLTGGLEVSIEFASPFFTAQKAQSLLVIDAFIERSIAVAAAAGDPSMLDRIDFDRANVLRANLSDVPAEILRPDEEVDLIREERADLLEQQRRADLIQQGAEVNKTVQEGRNLQAVPA
jgi:hypothetical protein